MAMMYELAYDIAEMALDLLEFNFKNEGKFPLCRLICGRMTDEGNPIHTVLAVAFGIGAVFRQYYALGGEANNNHTGLSS